MAAKTAIPLTVTHYDINGLAVVPGKLYEVNPYGKLVSRILGQAEFMKVPSEDPLASEIEAYPAYWRKLPKHWAALDYYRVRELFPLPAEYQSARLDHSLKKLLVPGVRTGGKSFYKDVKEAHATLGQWLKDNVHVALNEPQ